MPNLPDSNHANVTFAGAGPGCADHLTLGACRALQRADVVILDRRVGVEILALIPTTTRRIDMGQPGFGPSTAQSDIKAALVAKAALVTKAARGLRIVRLTGGDCGIFGRLNAQIAALQVRNLTQALPQLHEATA